MRKTVVVYADVSGYYNQVVKSMETFGCTSTHIPDNIHLVFAGDMVHRGPKSFHMLQMLDYLKENYPNNITLLLGNHESNYIRVAPHKFDWHGKLEPEESNIIRKWWDDGTLRVAAGIINHTGNTLVTHAGLTPGFWQNIGCPQTIHETIKTIDTLQQNNDRMLWNPGVMLTGSYDVYAGPIWAEAANEVLTPWMEQEMLGNPPNYGQIYGHSQPYYFTGKQWNMRSEFARHRVHVDTKNRWTTSIIGGHYFIGCDPCHSNQPAPHWKPYVYDDARVLENLLLP